MIVVYNIPGLAMVGAGVLVGVAVAALPLSVGGAALFACGSLWVVADVAYRWKRGGRSFFAPSRGGQLYFVPVWVLGLLLLGLGVAVRNAGREQADAGRQIEQRARELRARRPATAPADDFPAAPATRDTP